MSETDRPQKGDVRLVYLWGNGAHRLARIIKVDDYEEMALVEYLEYPDLRPEWVRYDQF
jgi:hypothetical protein